jgi:hypothetical protein
VKIVGAPSAAFDDTQLRARGSSNNRVVEPAEHPWPTKLQGVGTCDEMFSWDQTLHADDLIQHAQTDDNYEHGEEVRRKPFRFSSC